MYNPSATPPRRSSSGLGQAQGSPSQEGVQPLGRPTFGPKTSPFRDPFPDRFWNHFGAFLLNRPQIFLGTNFGTVWAPFCDVGTHSKMILERFGDPCCCDVGAQFGTHLKYPPPRHSCYNSVPESQGQRVPALALTIASRPNCLPAACALPANRRLKALGAKAPGA